MGEREYSASEDLVALCCYQDRFTMISCVALRITRLGAPWWLYVWRISLSFTFADESWQIRAPISRKLSLLTSAHLYHRSLKGSELAWVWATLCDSLRLLTFYPHKPTLLHLGCQWHFLSCANSHYPLLRPDEDARRPSLSFNKRLGGGGVLPSSLCTECRPL
jgi:hypothetical protein